MKDLVYLHVRTPKDDETTIESSTQIFSSLLPNYFGLFKRMVKKPRNVSFEIYLLKQKIYFYIVLPRKDLTFIASLMASSYPRSVMLETTDPMEILMKSKQKEIGEMVLDASYHYPLKTYKDFGDVDPIGSLIGFLAKQQEDVDIGIQILTTPASFPWQSSAIASTVPKVNADGTTSKEGTVSQSAVASKTQFQGGKTLIRILAATNDSNPLTHLQDLAGTFGAFSSGGGNHLKFKRPIINKNKLYKRMRLRTTTILERRTQILNAQELATLWHPPGKALSGIKNISWGKTLAGEPPENIPAANNMSNEEKQGVNFFATTEFKNQNTIFGIKDEDRRKHVYIMGKTGAGKSTLIANMAIDDIRKGRGIGVIDPHGDLTEQILDYIPKRRLNDVVYLEPFDTERPFALNVLEIKNKQHKDLIASGIVGIFSKIYADSWGPRLEYILRNTIFSLLEIPNATLIDALRILSEREYRNRVVPQITDPVIRNFWENEFDKMTDKLRVEAISPIQNKVGQFVSSKMIRNIIGQPKSTIDLEDIMNSGKILLLNLSQGKLGEDNASLLGAMIITQIQLAAMNRAFMKEEDRRDFFLYVDEFQNFATSSFIKILSEARKYRLAITLANQYIDQLDVTIQKAIFGNAGTLISFVTGAGDAALLQQEYAGIYTQNDLVSLGKHEIVLKLSIDGMSSMPFPAKTLPPPSLKNDNREAVIRLSKERYGRKAT
jgi:hypothetical protein